MVINDILEESREYYLPRKRNLVGFLLGVPRGSFRKKVINGGHYCYLHGRDGAKTVDVYLGKDEDESVELLKKKLATRSRFIDEVKIARNALKSLGVKKDAIDQEDFGPPLKRIFEEFDRPDHGRQGLSWWGAGASRSSSILLEWSSTPSEPSISTSLSRLRTTDLKRI